MALASRWGERGSDKLMATAANAAPRIPWDVFVRKHFQWIPGQHIGLIGPTGQGKTTLLQALLPLHKYVVVFATKPKDDSMSRLTNHGYKIIQEWKPIPALDSPKRILWPDASKLNSTIRQKKVFSDAFDEIYHEGGWTVAIDELWYFTNALKLEFQVKQYLLQARSLGISLLVATQRPAWVPLEVYDQSTHLFFWRDNDENNLSRISGINYRNVSLIKELVSNLEQHQALYVNTRTGKMIRTRAPRPSRNS